MRLIRFLSLPLLLAAAPLVAQAKKGTKPADPDKPVTGGGNLPAGWSAQTDTKGKEGDVKFIVMDKGYHATLGPATILWRASDKVDGAFHTVVLFTQTRPSGHPEGYGLFIGGQGLGGDGEKYTYFLIRQDGKFLVKRRDGAVTSSITSDWKDHPAIIKPNAAGQMTNRLEITVDKDKLVFSVNGKDVYSADPRLIDAKGVVGLRVNHNLDVHIEEFAVHKL